MTTKGTEGKSARVVPLIEEVRPVVARRLDAVTAPHAGPPTVPGYAPPRSANLYFPSTS